MTTERVLLVSLSAAMDGGFIAVADVNKAMAAAGATHDHRLIGGVAVMLHVQRLQLDLPLRTTGDADFGVPPHVLRRPQLVEEIEALGYGKALGNRWERQIDERRVAAVDLLVPTYRTRARNTIRVGDITTTEVPGLAEALRRPPVMLDVELRLTDGTDRRTTVVLPDAIGLLALKAGARSVRQEHRDTEDLWRCLEIAAASGVTPSMFNETPYLRSLRRALAREFGKNGTSLSEITRGLQPDASARLRTRIRALLGEVADLEW